MDLNEIIKTCRICLQKRTNSTVDLFSDKKESKDVLDRIFLCFQIILSYEDYLPKVICNNCLEELNVANKFRLKCISFEERYSAILDEGSKNQSILESEGYNCATNDEHIDGIGDNSDDDHKIDNKVDEQKLKCEICKKILKSGESLLKHTVNMHDKRKHVGKVTGYGANRRYNCTECDYSTPHSQTLVNHMRRHNGERPFKCACGKTFSQSSSLTAHRKTHSLTTYYTCSTCGKQFKHSFSLKKHLLVHDPQDFTCNVCHKVLKSRQTLQDHMHRHLNIRNYNCEHCGDTFVTSSELQSHKKTHSINKTLVCHLCDYKTNDNKYLVLHLKRHAGDKSYRCDLCHFTFYTKADVRRHMRVHTKEKPFSCPTCSQRFAHSTSMNKHMLTVHGLSHKWQDLKRKEHKRTITAVTA